MEAVAGFFPLASWEQEMGIQLLECDAPVLAGSIMVPISVENKSYDTDAMYYGAQLADKTGRNLFIVHAVHEPGDNPGLYRRLDPQGIQYPMSDLALNICKRRIETLQAEHPEFKSLQNPILCIVRGLPASRIVQIAEKWQICCIVMCKSRRGELLGKLSHSSITDSVTARTSCPVLQIDSMSSKDAVNWLSGTTAHTATSPQIPSDPARVQ